MNPDNPQKQEKLVREEVNDVAIWGAINGLREEQSDMKERMATSEQQHRSFDEWRQENKKQMDLLIAAVNGAALQYAEAKGAARLGKWVIALLVSAGLGSWVTAYITHGGPTPPATGG